MMEESFNTLISCATRLHSWQKAAQIGVSVCEICTLAIPPVSLIRPCPFHRHTGSRKRDCPYPLTTLRRIAP
jgi:hypothetical protein